MFTYIDANAYTHTNQNRTTKNINELEEVECRFEDYKVCIRQRPAKKQKPQQ